MSNVDHPPHYNQHPAQIECIDVAEAFTFNLGNAIKYIWRAGLKSPDPLEDLAKAQWYLQREITRLQVERTTMTRIVEGTSDNAEQEPQHHSGLTGPT